MGSKYIEVEGDYVIIENEVNDLDVRIIKTQGKYILIVDGIVYTEFSNSGGDWDEQGLKDFFYGFTNCLNVFEITLTKKEQE